MEETAPIGALFVGVEVTRHCNLRCPHCFTSSGGQVPRDPSTAQLQGLLSELADAGIRSVAFTGGEPLLRKDLTELVHHCKQAGIDDLGMVTNGFLVTPTLARELYEAGLRTVQVSLDGVDAIDHAAVRACTPADFYRSLRAIRLLTETGMMVHVATIVSPRNVQRAPEMALFCEALAVRSLRYCTFVPAGRAADAEITRRFTVDVKQLDTFLAFVRQLNQQPGARLQISVDHSMGPWGNDGRFHCESGKGIVYISVQGHLYPCPGLIFDAFRVGNVYESSVRELLQSPALSNARCIPREQLDGICATCPNDGCSGGCRGVAYATTGQAKGAVTYCNFHRRHQQDAETGCMARPE